MGYDASFIENEPLRTAVDVLEGATLLEFGAPWCEHCNFTQPLIATAFSGHPQVRHIRVEDGPGRLLGRSFRVKLWPTLVFLWQGKEILRLVRPQDAEAIRQALAQIDLSH